MASSEQLGRWRCGGNLSAVLTLMSGALGLLLFGHCQLDKHFAKYQAIFVGGGGSDVMSWTPLMIGVTSLSSLFVGFIGMKRRFRMTLTAYIFLTGSVLVAFFMVGLIITEQKSTLQNHLHSYMAIHFQAGAMEGDRFGVSETWDYLQIQLSCCGVDSYRDYLHRNEKGLLQKQDIPFSCCTLKTRYPLPEPENPSQCQHDASLSVADSRFLNVQGCHGSLSRWYMHHIATMSGFLFLIICLQGIGVFYLSYLGYRNTAQLEKRTQQM